MKNNRMYLHPRMKYSIKKLYNFTCSVCNKQKLSEELEIDHKIPSSSGGTNEKSNLYPICIECHRKKTSFEWNNGDYLNKNECITAVEDKLKQLLVFLNDKKTFTYPEIVFMVLNHPILSKFEYNTTILAKLLEQVRGIKPIINHNCKFMRQRDVLVHYLLEKEGLTLRECEKRLLGLGISISYVQIRTICAKFGEKQDKEAKNKKKVDEIEEKALKNEEIDEN